MKNLVKIHNEKFKSIHISNNFCIPIKDKTNGTNAILALVLSKSCNKYKTEQEIEKYLYSLYGTKFTVDVQKIGDLLNIEFSIKVINYKELIEKENIVNKAINFLNEIIYNHGEFKEDIFNRERNYILNKIKTRKDEKLKYAVIRSEELLCKNEPFGKFIYGEEENVNKVSLKDIKEAYNNLINNSINIVTITGNLNDLENIENNIKVLDNDIEIKYNNIYDNLNDEIKEYKEYIKTNQSVITIGMKVENLKLEDFYSLIVYNTILGGSPSSKLFQNVREKESLAYTVKSRYYRFKGVFVVYGGINQNNYEKAKKVILKQIEDMKNNISDIELNTAKEEIISNLLEWEDSKNALAKNSFTEIIEKRNETINEIIEKIKNISIQDVYNISNKIKVKTIYLLGGEVDE